MDITIHYRSDVDKEKKIDRIIDHFDKEIYSPKIVDFPASPKWIKSGYIKEPDYKENWEKYSLSSWYNILKDKYNNKMPEHYKGIILDLDPGCEYLTFVFGRFSKDYWSCRNFTKTQFARDGFLTHVRAINLLKSLKPMVDKLEVIDEAELWEHEDLKRSMRIFSQSEMMIKNLGRVLKKIAKEQGGVVLDGYEMRDEEIWKNKN